MLHDDSEKSKVDEVVEYICRLKRRGERAGQESTMVQTPSEATRSSDNFQHHIDDL